MLTLWIGGLTFIGAGLAAIFRGLRGLETQFENSLLIGGLIFVSSGLVIGTLGLVIRQLNGVRDALEAGVERPSAATAETIPVIPTATLERPSPASPIKPKEAVAPNARLTESESAPSEKGPSHLLPRSPDARQAFAVIRSGTVNNMDYELRADGTIVATLSGQSFEFRSIDELRRYLAALSQGNGDTPGGRRPV
ncbi:hypothetical protein [Bradyrhizobium cenepequi]